MATAPRHRLLVLRHSKADSPEGVSDADRPLAARGRRDAPGVGEWLAGSGLTPDLVLSSDALRTRQTAELVLEALGGGAAPDVRYLPELYSAGVHRVLEIVAGAAESVTILLVVGHEPTMSAAVTALTGEPVSFPTSALAVVELDGPWASVTEGAGRLATVRTP